MLLLFLSLAIGWCCHGFLLDGITNPPPTGNVLSDTHFTMVLKVLAEERQLREKLEKSVSRVQQELINTKIQNCNCGSNSDTLGLKNRTDHLENQLHTLQVNFNSLLVRYHTLEQKQRGAEAKTGVVEQEIGYMKGLKNVSDNKSVSQLQNFTKHLEQELQTTNGKIANIESNGQARSQDLVALFNTVKATENRATNLELRSHTVDLKLETIEKKLSNVEQNITDITHVKLMSLQESLQNNVNTLNSSLNTAADKIKEITNRTAVSIQTNSTEYIFWYGVIPFKTVQTSKGINDLSSLKNSGKFRCEKDGIYLISAYITTNSDSGGYYKIMKNRKGIAQGDRHGQNYGLTSTVIVLENLRIGDLIYVETGQSMNVIGGIQSTLTILQVG